MNHWDKLSDKLDLEIKHNLSELEKMVSIYTRVGLTAQANDIAKQIRCIQENAIDLDAFRNKKSA